MPSNLPPDVDSTKPVASTPAIRHSLANWPPVRPAEELAAENACRRKAWLRPPTVVALTNPATSRRIGTGSKISYRSTSSERDRRNPLAPINAGSSLSTERHKRCPLNPAMRCRTTKLRRLPYWVRVKLPNFPPMLNTEASKEIESKTMLPTSTR
ncbi:Uncharacterised protein [Bordetella pertussis]|nr:Uncharacterised protein [Bordetella pertussis]CFP60876.1 Uncharacterised protein [Bordetella pertussis]CFV96497.1 Uncharacterised protein [Bordetella pertussis]